MQIDGLAVVASDQLDLTHECGTPMKPIFEGVLEDRSIREQLESVVMIAFDAAQSTPPSSGSRWLFAGETPER